MRLFFDATVMEQPFTGVAKWTNELYRTCMSIDPGLEITAVLHRPFYGGRPLPTELERPFAWLPGRLWRNPAMYLTAWKKRPDFFHFPWNGDVPYLPSSIRVVATINDLLPLEIPGYFKSESAERKYRRKKKRDIERSHLIITISEYSRSAILREFGGRIRMEVIYPGPTLTKTVEDSDSVRPFKEPYFLYVGGYHSRKGLDDLLRVFLELFQCKKIRAKLVLAGEKRYYSEQFKFLIKKGSDCGCFKEMGYVSDTDLIRLYLGASALVYPSRYEGFGLPPLEAMSLGCPVVTVRRSSIPEVCGEAVLYFDPDEMGSLAASLVTIEKNTQLCHELKAKGLRQAANFSWEKAALKYLSALRQVPAGVKMRGAL